MTTFQGLVIIRESRIGPCRGSRAASQFRRQKSDYDSDDSDNDSDNGSDKCSDKCSDKRSDNEGPGDDSPARCVPQRPAPGRGRAAMSWSRDRAARRRRLRDGLRRRGALPSSQSLSRSLSCHPNRRGSIIYVQLRAAARPRTRPRRRLRQPFRRSPSRSALSAGGVRSAGGRQ